MAAEAEELQSLPEVGSIVADSIQGFFRDPVMQESIARMRSYGLKRKRACRLRPRRMPIIRCSAKPSC